MRKSILKWSLMGALILSVPVSFNSCKDYDDDISTVNQKNDELSSQLKSLQTALEAAKQEAAQAKADADLAKEAAAKAKAEAISEVMKQVNDLIAKTATKEELSELAGKISGIESSLNQLKGDVNELAKWKQAVDIQIKALEEFQKNAESTLDDLQSIKDAINNLKGIQAQLNQNTSDIALLKTQIEGISSQISSSVSSHINTLAGVLALRLTSITLVPTAYVDGIPAIDFRTAQYTVKKWNGTAAASTGVTNTVSNGTTKAKYRLNPANVTLADINVEGMGYVNEVADSRSGSELNKLIKISGNPSIADGILTVTTDKVNPSQSLNLSDPKKINIVALKVPIAKKNILEGESESGAVVYSEYIRVMESSFTPEIGSVATPVNHWADSTTVYQSSMLPEQVASQTFVKTLQYDKTLDLNTIVAGCAIEGTNHNAISLDELKSYGLTLRYAIAKGAYKADDGATDQQQFGKIEGSILSSKTPSSGIVSPASIDKQPIVRICLVDTVRGTNAKPLLVDQKYMKIRFTKDNLEPTVLDAFDLGTATLGCSDVVKNLDWTTITEKIYVKLNLSKEEFAAIYTAAPQVVVDGISSNAGASSTVTSALNGTSGAATHPVVWTTNIEAIGTVPVNPGYKDLVAKVTYKDPKGLHADVTITLKLRVNLAMPFLTHFGNYWQDMGKTYRVLPLQYGTPGAGTTCEYKWNAWSPFNVNDNGSIVTFKHNDFTSCSSWDMQFVNTQPGLSGYRVNDQNNNPSEIGNYKISKGAVAAINLTWTQTSGTHVPFVILPTKSNSTTIMTIAKNSAGKGVLGNKVKMGVWARINKFNTILVEDYDLLIVKPLKNEGMEVVGEFTDGLISGSVVDCSKAFQLKDFRGYTVAKTTTGTSELEKYASALYTYYEVEDPVWDVANAKIGYKRDSNGNLVVDDNSMMPLKDVYPKASVSIDANNNLVFKNNGGNAIEQKCFIYVPVSVNYGWGQIVPSENNGHVKIRVNPGNIVTAVGRK